MGERGPHLIDENFIWINKKDWIVDQRGPVGLFMLGQCPAELEPKEFLDGRETLAAQSMHHINYACSCCFSFAPLMHS